MDSRKRFAEAVATLAEHEHAHPALDPSSVEAAEWLPLLELGARFVERYKTVRFPAQAVARWRALAVEDARVSLDAVLAPVDHAAPIGRDALVALAEEASRRLGEPPRPRVLALDYRGTRVSEVVLESWLYGVATLFPRSPPLESVTDPRILQAKARGWSEVLAEANLLPHSGMLVEPERVGLFLEAPAFASVAGVVALLDAHGSRRDFVFEANPFVEKPRNDAALAAWFAWGRGRAEALGCA